MWIYKPASVTESKFNCEVGSVAVKRFFTSVYNISRHGALSSSGIFCLFAIHKPIIHYKLSSFFLLWSAHSKLEILKIYCRMLDPVTYKHTYPLFDMIHFKAQSLWGRAELITNE